MRMQSRLWNAVAAAALLLTVTMPATAAVNATGEDVITLDSRLSRFEYKPNEVIVKFRSTSGVNVRRKNGKFLSASDAAVDRLLRSLGAEDVEQLMPNTGATPTPARMKAYNGTEVPVHDLSMLYVVKMNPASQTDVTEAVRQLGELEEVEYAEPNYLVHALDDSTSATPDDPMYSLQYGISAIRLDKLWGVPVISKEGPVIAILDTGVEITHPDLAANIWTNEKEQNGSEGYDDDGNGYMDDLHGWDFINQTGTIDDYNGHGTHCAGIAAACGFNGKGIIGANPYARIMPLTVMQSNGTGDIGTLIRAIDYAAANGADIISMSLGTYATSVAFEQALGRAYQRAVIIAAAGNDGYCLNHKHPERGQMAPAPMFPAAYQFVLGVQASAADGSQASFTNYDDNGAVYSAYPEDQLYNYELTAPGVSIMSTYPGGTYKYLNGTSMATPLVAGAISRLLQAKEYDNRESLFGDLIHTAAPNGVLDIMAAYRLTDADRVPTLYFVGTDIDDSAAGDGDGRPDAGETLDIYPTLRADWGSGIGDIRTWITLGENEQEDIVEILTTEVDFGHTLSAYAKGRSVNPLRIKIKDDCADGRIIRLQIHASCPATSQELVQNIEITAENAVTLTGILKENTTLTADQHYVITNTFGVPEGVTLTIEPGTTIKFRANAKFVCEGELIANGEPGKMITFTSTDYSYLSNIYFQFNKEISFCIFEYFNCYGDCFLRKGIASHCIFRNNNFYELYQYYYDDINHFKNCSFYNLRGSYLTFMDYVSVINSNFVNNACGVHDYYGGICIGKERLLMKSNVFNNRIGYSDLDFIGSAILYDNRKLGVITPTQPSYLGTSSLAIAKERVIDINHPMNEYVSTQAEYGFSNTPWEPIAEAPGIVWKVLVNGKDAQDEFDELPPLGVGRHKFEVYFNRPMNKAVTPMVAMGVRAPYTQTAIAEDGAWNDEGTVYTAYLTINGKADYDGLNRIYVAEAEDDQYFEIPVEDIRFNVYVSAAGSMSEGFYAEAGLGKVELTWESSEGEIDDVLGYNLYRYTVDEEGNVSDTLQINRRLIDETTFTDFDVTPGNTYLYYYKTLRTDMKENSASKVVAATPLTASKGDANGSMSVDVADVVTEVAYITGGKPQPFIFEAADVNTDEEVNILDIVGTINIINTPANPTGSSATEEPATAYFSVENGVLYVECGQPIGGLQVRLNADRTKTDITTAAGLDAFEEVANWVSDNEFLYMMFSMSGQTLAPGRHALLHIGDAKVSEVVAAGVNGANLPTELEEGATPVAAVAEATGDFRVYPNPATDIVNVDYVVPCDSKVFFVMTGAQGTLVETASRFSPAGKNTLRMEVSNLPAGVYFIQMLADGKPVKVFKVIKK